MVASAMGDLESVAGIVDFTSEMSCFLWTRLQWISVELLNAACRQGRPTVCGALRFAWCGLLANLPLRGHELFQG